MNQGNTIKNHLMKDANRNVKISLKYTTISAPLGPFDCEAIF